LLALFWGMVARHQCFNPSVWLRNGTPPYLPIR
jgi:hypothetical protein